MKEEWRDIKGYEGIYQVSNYGRIKSLSRIISIGRGHFRLSNEKILKQSESNKGYYIICLHNNYKERKHLVHRIVYESFIGDIPKGMEVNHIDENPKNNKVTNLNLLTHKENLNWGTVRIRQSEKHKGKINNHLSKKTLQYDLDGNLIKEWPSSMEIERQLGFRQGNIGMCCRGIRKSAYGYVWKYS